MFKITSRWPHQTSIKVEWNLGKRCNYDCSYCPSEIHDNFSKHTDIEILLITIDYLKTLNKPIRLSFTGGEPCVHPKFEKLITYAKEKEIQWISVTTNGTRPYEFYKNLPVNQYVISIHFEHDWRTVVDTLKKLKDNTKFNLIGQIMAHHDYMDFVRNTRQFLSDVDIPNTVRRIRWTDGDHDLFDDSYYQPDDLTWIKEQEATVPENCIIDDTKIMHSNDIIKLHLNQFKNWKCNAGLESLMINWDGEVYRATCRVGGSLGNIYNKTFLISSLPVICSRNFCTCSADIPLSKEKVTF